MPRKIREISVEATDPASDDFIPLSGAVNGGRKINLAKYASNRLALRASRPQVISDGSTSLRGLRWQPGTRGNFAGASVISFGGFVDVGTTNPAANEHLLNVNEIGSTTAVADATRANSLYIYRSTAGSLVVKQTGAAGTDYRQQVFSTFTSSYGGRRVLVNGQINAGTGSLSLWIDGVDISGSLAAQVTNGTPPDWLAASLSCAAQVGALNFGAGDAPLFCWINAALTDADRTYWLTHGVPPEWVLRGGSRIPTYSQDFTSGTDSWTGSGFLFTSITNDAGELRLAGTGTLKGIIWRTSTMSVLKRYTVRATFRMNAGAAAQGIAYVGFRRASTYSEMKALDGVNPITITWTGVQTLATDPGGGDRLMFAFANTNTTSQTDITLAAGEYIWIDDISVTEEGALGYPVVGPDRFVRDATRISPPIDGYMVGMRPLSTETQAFFRFTTTHSGNIQAFGQSAFDTVGAYKLIRWTVTNENVSTFTVSLGSSSGGTDYVSGLSVPTGTTEVDLMGQPNISNSLWVACTDTGSISHTLTYERIQT